MHHPTSTPTTGAVDLCISARLVRFSGTTRAEMHKWRQGATASVVPLKARADYDFVGTAYRRMFSGCPSRPELTTTSSLVRQERLNRKQLRIEKP